MTSQVMELADHEAVRNGFGGCDLCGHPADDSHDGKVAASRARVEGASASARQEFHMGPGPHPGTGTSQAVHGAKRGGRMTKATFRDGGATYQPVLLNTPKKGFPVAMFPERNVNMPAGEFDAAAYNAYEKAQKAFIAADPARHIGTWLDRATDRVHLDVVHVLTDEGEARRTAIEMGEIAYFSFETMEEVRVDGS